VREWCRDWYGTYGADAVTAMTDPRGPVSGDGRIQRGGDYSSTAPQCRSAQRSRNYPYIIDERCGFRVCVQPQRE